MIKIILFILIGILIGCIITNTNKRRKLLCNHKFEFYEASNILQQDDMGYPLRLYMMKCSKCEKYEYRWVDVSESVLDEIESGKSVLLKWTPIK